ncbi:hypothetical protein [Paraburkholderia caffeinilytica]|uniref:Membrane protein n=1 Tax=Paraburkholderia caffeinilytica TaxID=1761016 RepID=A0ABQ1MY99_9BURK|nr:hypothetical protein [Paraburkholderia caffeinilytica]GGC49190.1 membrane protein [Paraburkholderia caffeinilytica]CAB3787975.1 hypothetical protein LMG28690_02529 [Paraburkholderia caffeinilytica]
MSATQTSGARYAWQDWLVRLSAVAALLVSGLIIVPFQPWFAQVPSLDMSWAFAMNVAVAEHMVFGKDVIFTFGPWASVYTTLYHPATDTIMLIGSAIIAAGLCAGFALLAFDRRPALLLLLPLAISESILRDTIFFAVPLVVLLATARLSCAEDHPNFLKLTPARATLFLVSVCGVSTLPLIKGSFAGLAFGELGCAILMLILARRITLAATSAIVAIVSLCIGWSASGQSLVNLPNFFTAQRPIISGYSEAMSVHGPFLEVGLWMLPAVVALWMFFVNSERGYRRLLPVLGLAFYLFVVFKAGFVRQDGHQRMSSTSLLFVALSLATMLRKREAVVLGCASIAIWISLELSMAQGSLKYIADRPLWSYAMTSDGLARRLTDPAYFGNEFTNGLMKVRQTEPVSGIEGTTDVYPTDLSMLFANDIPWLGRPILQSYSVYRPQLDQANADHLTGKSAPQNVLFSVGAIDDRLRALEDALSWGALLTNYSIVGQQGKFIQMKKTLPPRATSTTPLVDTDAKTNEPVVIPAHDGIVIARIHMRPTLLGQAVLMAYKLPQVYIELALTTGKTVRYRYIPEMGETGFVLSPLVASNDDFVAMAAGHDTASVKEIRLVSPSNLLWKKNIHVTLETLRMQPQADAQKLFSSTK